MIVDSLMRGSAALSKHIPELSPLYFIHFIAHILIIPTLPVTTDSISNQFIELQDTFNITYFTEHPNNDVLLDLTKLNIDLNSTPILDNYLESQLNVTSWDIIQLLYTNDSMNKDYMGNKWTYKDERIKEEGEVNESVTFNPWVISDKTENSKERNQTKVLKEIAILGLFDLSIRLMERPEGISELAAAKLAIEHVNGKDILPGYEMKLYTNDSMCDPGVGVDRFFHALYTKNTSRMLMLLGTACSEVTESLAKIVPYWNMVQVSFGATSPALSDRSEFPYFFRTVAADCSHNPARITFLRRYGWNAVVAFSQNEERFSLATNGLVTDLEAANITCTASLTFSERNYKEQLLLLKELDTRIIIASFEPDFLPKIFCEVYHLGMIDGDYAWIVAGSTVSNTLIPCKRYQLSAALEGVVLVSSSSQLFKDDSPPLSGLTYESFLDTMKESNVPPSPNAAYVYDAVWAMAIALHNAEMSWSLHANETHKPTLMDFDYKQKDIAENLIMQFEKLNFTGVSGPVSFKGPDRVGTTSFLQIQNGSLRTLALYRGGVSSWQCDKCAHWRGGYIPVARRVLKLRVVRPAASARLAITALALFGVALALAFLLFNLHFAELRSIKLSSPRLTNMTLVGSVLVYSAVALLASETDFLSSFIPLSLICTAKAYLLAAGFSLAFGSMFAKTYRVHRIFISKYRSVCKTKLLHDTQLITLVCTLLLIDGLVVTVWVTTDPMEKQLQNLTREISSTDRSVVYQLQVEICRSQHMNIWLGSFYAYKGLLLIMGVYMAWETRHVKISALNDSKYIGISVYGVVITSAGAVVLENIISEKITLAFVSITGLILLTTTGTLCLLFMPKLYDFLKNSDVDPVVQSMGLKIECNTRRFVTTDPQEIYFRTEIQNKVYKKEIAVLDKEIHRLEKLLLGSQSSSSSSDTSLFTAKKLDIELGNAPRKGSQRIPSISGGLPMLLLSILPPVIPRASWPSAYNTVQSEMRKSVTFSSQPKLFPDKTDMENILKGSIFNKRKSETPGLFNRIKGFFGSRPVSRKTSTVSIAQNNSEFTNAFKMHMEVVTGLVSNKDTFLKVPQDNLGPQINITSTEDFTQCYDLNEILPYNPRCRSKSQNFEPKVHFNLQENTKNSGTSLRKGSPRFPHKLKPDELDEVILVHTDINEFNQKQKCFSESEAANKIKDTSNLKKMYKRNSLPNVTEMSFVTFSYFRRNSM